jgi:hypothetical protein
MIKRIERLKNTVNKYMANIRPDRLTTCHSERKSVVSQRPCVLFNKVCENVMGKIIHRYLDFILPDFEKIYHSHFVFLSLETYFRLHWPWGRLSL